MMRARSILSEAWRNVSSGTARAGLLAVGTILIVVALGVVDALAVNQILAAAESYQRSGGSTYILVANGRVSGAVCDGFSQRPEVQAAGALREKDRLSFAALPDQPVTQFVASHGFTRVVGVASPGVQQRFLLERTLSRALGAEAGTSVRTNEGAANVGGTFDFPDDGRVPRLVNSAVSIEPTKGLYDECWVRFWPVPDGARTELLLALAPQQERTEYETLQLNPTLGASFDASAQFSARPTRFAPPVALVLCALLGLVIAVRRRLEYALLRHQGVSTTQIVSIAACECGIAFVPALLIAFVINWGGGGMLFGETAATVLPAQTAVLAAGFVGLVCSILVVAAMASRTQLAKLVSER